MSSNLSSRANRPISKAIKSGALPCKPGQADVRFVVLWRKVGGEAHNPKVLRLTQCETSNNSRTLNQPSRRADRLFSLNVRWQRGLDSFRPPKESHFRVR